jgi:hypothetical protein
MPLKQKSANHCQKENKEKKKKILHALSQKINTLTGWLGDFDFNN